MIVSLVGCGKDYGIYTERGYNIAESNEERLEISRSFYSLSKFVKGVKNKSYLNEVLVPEFHATEYTWDTIYCEIETMYSCLIGKSHAGYEGYINAYNRLAKYVTEENIDRVYLTQDEFYEYYDYIYGTNLSD